MAYFVFGRCCGACRHADHEALRPAAEFTPRAYPPPDNEVRSRVASGAFISSCGWQCGWHPAVSELLKL